MDPAAGGSVGFWESGLAIFGEVDVKAVRQAARRPSGSDLEIAGGDEREATREMDGNSGKWGLIFGIDFALFAWVRPREFREALTTEERCTQRGWDGVIGDFGGGLRGFWRDGFARRGAEIAEERQSGSGKYGV